MAPAGGRGKMAGRVVDLGTWNRADQFRFFRGFQRPHYAITARVDVTRLKGARRAGLPLAANTGQRDDLAYLSCLPWLDYTSLDNALPHAEDCIPRVSWGKFVETGGRWSCAMTMEVHHVL